VVVLSVTAAVIWASSSAENNDNDDTTTTKDDTPTNKNKTTRIMKKQPLFDVQDLIAPRTFDVHDPMFSNNENVIHPDARGAFDGRRPRKT
jgi:hypothetical protein